ncbi:MAG: energy transducer TonB [Terriglobales bacterium]
MTSRRSLFLVLTLTFLCSRLSANKKDAEAAALIEHAKQVSDIRMAGAPAFRLKLSFSIIKEDGSTEKGLYTEVWNSETQWRKETVLGDFRRTQVVAGRKRWLLDSATDAPEYLSDFLSLTNITGFQPESWKPQKVEDRELNGRSMRCLETNPNPWGGRSALSFDKISGAITAEVRPFQVGTRIGETVCFYNDYEKFGDRLLARSYECDKDKRRILEATVIESAAASPAGEAFFTPPDGAKESVNCLGPVKPPKAVHAPAPDAPRTSGGQALVVMDITVGTDGKPHNLKVTSIPHHDFDEAALQAVRQWTFKPATCDGEPVEAKIMVNLEFHLP